MSDTAIVMSGSSALMPAMDMGQAQLAYQAMVDFVKGIMKDGTDFGTIPGTPKPTLYKPGAEKLTRFFGLAARFDITKEIEKWDGEEPFFYYRYKCTLNRLSDGQLVAEGEGSCNSHEKKYRYRNADRVCPSCGKSAIIKGKKEYGGGWLCYAKKGGCGAKFPDDHFGGEIEQVLNPDICDLVNTLQKMAQKRAFIAATLIACNASEYFTQDVEDLDYGVQVVTVVPEPDHKPAPQKKAEPIPPATDFTRPWAPEFLKKQTWIKINKSHLKGEITADQKTKLAISLNEIFEDETDPDAFRHTVVTYLTGIESSTELTKAVASVLIDWLESGFAPDEAYAIIRQDAIDKGQQTFLDADEQKSILDEAFPRDEHGNPVEDVA
jgi:hypothetical protein